MDIKDIITFDDNKKYVLCNKTKYNDRMYYYFTDMYDPSNIKICYLDNADVVEIMDQETISKLLVLFAQNSGV